jgi:glycosyltransferase involved in cell wall biosynthesis
MKVLMMAYACEPERGSEPGVGWGWAYSLPRHVDLTLVTRANNREVIEEWYARNDPDGMIQRPEFLYHDPPAWLIRLKKRGWLPVQFFFAIWIWGAVRRVRPRFGEFDVLHHGTYSAISLPGLFWTDELPVVIGPVGGTAIVRDDYLELYGDREWKERLRAFIIRHWKWCPWIRRSFGHAKLILCANTEARDMIEPEYPGRTHVMTEIGAHRADVVAEVSEVKQPGLLNLVWIGQVEPWKAWSITLRALAQAVQQLEPGERIQLTMLGRGRQERDAESLARELELGDHIRFLRRIPLEELQMLISNADAMVFSSVKDTNGTVVLESMSKGKPLICIRHQGAGDITTDECAIRVESGTMEETIKGFANAMLRMLREPGLATRMGVESRKRVLTDYVWDVKAERLAGFYQNLVDEHAALARQSRVERRESK